MWGSQEVSKITYAPDVAGSLNSTYWTFQVLTAAGATTDYYVWHNINSAGVDPTPGGTGIEVAGATSATAATLQAAAVSAINTEAGEMFAKADPDDTTILYVMNTQTGAVTATADGDTATLVFAQTQAGSEDDLGLLDGDIEFSPVEDAVDITAHQKGTQIIDQFRTGKNCEITMTLKETDVPNLKIMFGAASGGAEVTPGGGTEVIGWGESKRFTSMLADARKMVFHPIQNSSSDLTEDFAFWKAYPKPGSMVFSGENASTVSVTFTCYPFDKIADTVNLWCIGDHTQNLLK